MLEKCIPIVLLVLNSYRFGTITCYTYHSEKQAKRYIVSHVEQQVVRQAEEKVFLLPPDKTWASTSSETR